ncbi:MAG: DUF1501 domain-containing protein [Acidobacteriota bacterium]|nr:DUF1501 domain-containing protein [Acidobacteriota bacterium]
MGVDRRTFIKYASLAAAGNAAALRPFGALNALAQTTTDYKALVCIFLFGGNDANNTLVPFDTTGYANYANIRGPIALPQTGAAGTALLQLSNLPNFSLNPNLPEIASLFQTNNVALVANVGTLVAPTTKAQYQSGATVPTNLFSHSDQQLEWQNASKSGATQTGWAGRIADQLASKYNLTGQVPMITSVAGDTLFCNGNASTPVSVSPGNLGGSQCSEGTTECNAQQATAQALLSFDSGLTLVQADNNITNNAYSYAKTLTAATQSVTPLLTPFPAANGLATQLKQIAQIIQVRAALGVNRQIFFCGVGNFDTHSNQLVLQNGLLAQMSAAMNAFYAATVEMGVQNSVTSFTMSDFSRTFQPNSNTGTDHAWGSHHIVMGGAVKGGQLYGKFPTLTLNGPDDSGTNGRWVPSTGSAQYAATLASWFGVSAAQMPLVFPNIASFPTSNLGFV